MSNIKSKFSDMNIVTSTLTNKKQQTDYKIKYVSEYVNQWAIISSERDEISDITFIDCMCNAGVYKDGDLCTAMQIMLIPRKKNIILHISNLKKSQNFI